jgi:Fe-S-cluster containining protein
MSPRIPQPPPGPDPHPGDDTVLALEDHLPLTCTRAGTCCHGKQVWVNPWEVACLAKAVNLTPRLCRERHLCCGGIRIRFSGAPGWKDLPACDFYVHGSGCRAHAGRPLACRLYPLGRERQALSVRYLHQGTVFPCLNGCPDVTTLPTLTVARYLAGQGVAPGEAAQEAYLAVMQDLADGAFILLLESGLAARGDTATLRAWRQLGSLPDDVLPTQIEPSWLDLLTVPDLTASPEDPVAFIAQHLQRLQERAQRSFADLTDDTALHEASCLMMALALHLGRSLGCSPLQATQQWIATALAHGAQEGSS